MGEQRAKDTGKFFIPGKTVLELPDNPFADGAKKVREEKDAKELETRLREAHELKQKDIEERLEGLEIIPNGNRVIVMPYPSNPYVRVMTESGIFIEPSGMFFNPDSGTMDTMEEAVICGKVIEVGPECKVVAIGDDIYYNRNSISPLPFMGLGYQTIAEQQITALVNNELKKRLGMNDGR